MRGIPTSLNELIVEFSKLPGIGKKTAERLAIHVLKTHKDNVIPLSSALLNVKNQIKFHQECHCFMEDLNCVICDDTSRDPKLLCIIKDPTDLFIIEKKSNVDKFILNAKRIKHFDEVFIALEPSSEGDTTSSYIAENLESFDIVISRLARGVPVGASFDYIDELTLTYSLKDRVKYK